MSSGGRYDSLINSFRSIILSNEALLEYDESAHKRIRKCKQTATGGVIHMTQIFKLREEMRLRERDEIYAPRHQFAVVICYIIPLIDSCANDAEKIISSLTKKKVEFLTVGSLVRCINRCFDFYKFKT